MLVLVILTILFFLIILVIDRRAKREKGKENFWFCKTFGNVQTCEDEPGDTGQIDGVLGTRIIL
jgi:hypothetical protein